MIRTQTIAACALGALLAASYSFGSGPQSAGTQPAGFQQSDPEVAALRKEVQTLKAEVESLRDFVDAQNAEGAALIDTLARVEAEGFTAGINFKSREILLAGLRSHAKAMQVSASKDEDTDDDAPAGRRRGN